DVVAAWSVITIDAESPAAVRHLLLPLANVVARHVWRGERQQATRPTGMVGWGRRRVATVGWAAKASYRSRPTTLPLQLAVDVAFKGVQGAIVVDRFHQTRMVAETVAVPVEDDGIANPWVRVERTGIPERLFREGDIRPAPVGRGFGKGE